MVNAAVMGAGYWGPNLIRNLVESPLCSSVTVCDTNAEQLRKLLRRYPGVHTTQDPMEVINSPTIDALMVATPPKSHFDIAYQALSNDKHVFVEKPFTLSTQHAVDLIELARKRKMVLAVGHTFEYSPPVQKIKEIIDAGDLGDVFYISSTRVNLGLHQKDASVIWDLAPHDLSMLFHWLGEEPIEVMATGKDFVQPGVPDVAFIFMRFKSGAIAHIQVSWLAPSKLRRTTIVGSQKMLVYDDTQNMEQVKIFDKGVDYRDPDTFGEYHLSYRAGDIVSPRIETFEPLQAEVTDFLECVIKGNTPRTDGESGLRVVRVLEAVERSLSNSGHVEILNNEDALV